MDMDDTLSSHTLAGKHFQSTLERHNLSAKQIDDLFANKNIAYNCDAFRLPLSRVWQKECHMQHVAFASIVPTPANVS